MPEPRGTPTLKGVVCYLGIGSNLGAREARVFEALRRIEATGTARLAAVSSLYETNPVGESHPRWFVNAVAEVQTLLCPEDLLKRLKTIEKAMGRTGAHSRPRQIDLDVITYGDEVLRTPALTLPHPRYASRSFVLVPLAEVAPGFRCPASGRFVAEMLREAWCAVRTDPRDAACDSIGPGVRRISGRCIAVAIS